MATDLQKRAESLDNLRLKNVAGKLTLEEAQNIVSVWGRHLEHAGWFRNFFWNSIPKSSLPYPLEIIQGAIYKMEVYYHGAGQKDKVRALEETEILLTQYTDDNNALDELKSRISNEKWITAVLKGLAEYQINQADNGYLIDNKLWKLSKGRISELIKDF